MLRFAAALCFCAVALGAAQQPAAPASLDRSTFEAVRTHLNNSAFAEATALLAPFTSQTAADPTALYLHALVHLQQGTLDDADRLIERLRGRNTQAATGYANKLAPVLAAARANSALKDQFADAVRRFDGNGAASVLGKMDVSPQQRVALGVYIDTYRGRMTSALAALSGASMQKVPPNVRDTLRIELTTATAQFRDITEQLRWYTNSNLGSSACLPADARERSVASGLVLAEYVRLTELGLELFPFNERLMDLAFHGALLSAPYEDVEKLGDSILAAKGTISIPFYSSTSRLSLVLDDRTRRISMELDKEAAANVYGTEQLAGHQVFDHAYSAVRRIEQRANNTVSTGALRSDSYALKLNPSGAAPHYLFMTLVHCLYGEETQKQITHSLGRYVQHVLARYGSSVSTELVDPKQVTRERLQLFSQVVGTGVYITASAAENARRNATEVDDGRMPVSEILRNTAQEGKVLATRRAGLLATYDSLRRTQQESSRTWTATLGNGAVARALESSSARVEELIAFVSLP